MSFMSLQGWMCGMRGIPRYHMSSMESAGGRIMHLQGNHQAAGRQESRQAHAPGRSVRACPASNGVIGIPRTPYEVAAWAALFRTVPPDSSPPSRFQLDCRLMRRLLLCTPARSGLTSATPDRPNHYCVSTLVLTSVAHTCRYSPGTFPDLVLARQVPDLVATSYSTLIHSRPPAAPSLVPHLRMDPSRSQCPLYPTRCFPVVHDCM